MNKKLIHVFREIGNAVLAAGVIILMIGLYYLVIKAGIPYQDPTVEMQIQYAINNGIGSVLSTTGLILALCGGIARLVIWRVDRA
ncbi:MAG: hypothetical protein J1F42_09465 [Lachnospiraceae bacterium]|nr:hypothetical protein [Lachnospiraceae bacterium]